MTDVYDDPRPVGSRWTRVNIGEAISGVPTPLAWSVWKPAMEHGFWWSQVQLGVASRREYQRTPITTIALGRPAISVDVTVGQIARLPGYDPDAFAEQYFGLDPVGDATSGSPRDWSTLCRIAARAPATLSVLGRKVARASAAAQVLWSSSVDRVPDDPLRLLDEAAAAFRDTMAVHTLQGLVCQGSYQRVAALGPGLAERLISLDGDLAEAAIARDLWAWAHGGLAEDVFLRRHGFHGPDEGEIAAASWREDPTPVRSIARAWAEADDDRSPAQATARRADGRAAAAAELYTRTAPLRRPGVWMLLAATRRLVAQREVGKAAFLRCLDVARWASRHLGEDAVWCTLEELHTDRPCAAELRDRRLRRDELQMVDLPLSWIGDPGPITTTPRTAGRAAVVHGQGASPGVAEGTARVIIDPRCVNEPVGPDEVLVAVTTDPSWITLFLTAGALVIDVGGVLSHAAIIARELGIPCVIGTGDGTSRITPGARVRVDGAAGTVQIVE